MQSEKWNDDYLDELCLFPGGAFKDQVDASSGAFGKLMSVRGPRIISDEVLARAAAGGRR